MSLEPSGCASLSSKLRTIPDFLRAGGLRAAPLALLCGLSAAIFAQDQPTPQQPGPVPQQQTPAPTAAPPEIAADDPDAGEPVTVFGWVTSGPMKLRPGKEATEPLNQILNLPDFHSKSPGVQVSIPAGKFNHLEMSYFQADGSGDSIAAIPLGLFGSNFPQGTLISTSYRVRNAQMTWNFLTWPAPPEDSKFRFHTLYSFNYTNVSTVIDAPLDLDPNFIPGHGGRNIFYPALGLAVEYVPSKHLWVELRGWGFGLPHHADIGDAEINVVGRFKQFEIFGGYKMFHLKTSENNDQYFVGTIGGPMGGVRWVLH